MIEAKFLTNPQKWKPINQINKSIQNYNQQNKCKGSMQYTNKENLIVHWGDTCGGQKLQHSYELQWLGKWIAQFIYQEHRVEIPHRET